MKVRVFVRSAHITLNSHLDFEFSFVGLCRCVCASARDLEKKEKQQFYEKY